VDEDRIKVLYIAGTGRSGSTILGNVLNRLDGFFSVGEFYAVWSRVLLNEGLCSCGVPYAECEVWGTVLNKAFGGTARVDARAMERVQEASTRLRYAPLMLIPWGRRLLASRWKDRYQDNLERLYRAIQHTTGSRVIVDGSKLPLYGYVLETMPAIDLYVVHLVRDPRAVAYSWLRKKSRPAVKGQAYMPRRYSLGSSLGWAASSVLTEELWERSPERYLVLRYEDFVERPQESVRRILDLVQEEVTSLPFVSERAIELGINHNVGGNPSRFETGTVELRLDEEWVSRIKLSDSKMVTSLTFPLLRKYGYPISLTQHTPE
jgi:hypothetical protein